MGMAHETFIEDGPKRLRSACRVSKSGHPSANGERSVRSAWPASFEGSIVGALLNLGLDCTQQHFASSLIRCVGTQRFVYLFLATVCPGVVCEQPPSFRALK